MIYHCYFSGVYNGVPITNWQSYEVQKLGAFGTKVNIQRYLAEFIKQSKGDSFIFIITLGQEPQWKEFISTYKLEEFIAYEMPNYICNYNYPDRPPRLKLIVLTSTEHEWKEPFKED